MRRPCRPGCPAHREQWPARASSRRHRNRRARTAGRARGSARGPACPEVRRPARRPHRAASAREVARYGRRPSIPPRRSRRPCRRFSVPASWPASQRRRSRGTSVAPGSGRPGASSRAGRSATGIPRPAVRQPRRYAVRRVRPPRIDRVPRVSTWGYRRPSARHRPLRAWRRTAKRGWAAGSFRAG